MTVEPTHKADTDESLVDWVIDELGKAFTIELSCLLSALRLTRNMAAKCFKTRKFSRESEQPTTKPRKG